MTTQSTVIVAPLSPSHIVMLAMLAQQGPLAKESVMRKRNRLTEPKFRSQNLPIPSCPVVAAAAGTQSRRADGILHDRVRGEQGEPVVLAPGGDGGHGKARNAARRMIAVGSFPA